LVPSSGLTIRPRRLGELLDESFRLYFSRFGALLLTILPAFVPYLVVAGWVSYRLNRLFPKTSHLTAAQLDAVLTDHAGDLVTLLLILMAAALLLTPLAYGAIVRHVVQSPGRQRQQVSIADNYRFAAGRLLSVIGTQVVRALVFIVLIGGGSVLFAWLARSSGGAAGILLVILWSIAALIFFIWWAVQFSLAVYVALVEPMSGWKALMRSWHLVTGNFWRTLGYYIIVQVLVAAVTYGLGLVAQVAHNELLSLAVSGALNLVTEPFVVVAMTFLYLDLRVRRDGSADPV